MLSPNVVNPDAGLAEPTAQREPRDPREAEEPYIRWAPVADDLIAVIARPGDTIVTSDRGLIERLPAECQVTPARTFRRALDG